MTVLAGDLDGDGWPDLVAQGTVLRNDGTGLFVVGSSFPEGVGPNEGSEALADLDGDGRLDLVATTQSDVAVLTGNGDGTFAAAAHFGAGAIPTVPVAADLNGDGLVDLATANWSGSVSLLLNTSR
jgi:hypothetical protein